MFRNVVVPAAAALNRLFAELHTRLLHLQMTNLFRQLQEARADNAEKDALIETLRVRLQRMINCAHSSTETAQDCVQRVRSLGVRVAG